MQNGTGRVVMVGSSLQYSLQYSTVLFWLRFVESVALERRSCMHAEQPAVRVVRAGNGGVCVILTAAVKVVKACKRVYVV